jgi:Mn-dependent DtxR family transcriptional regulator
VRERLHREPNRRSPAESWVLWQMAAHGPISATALARRLDLDPTVLAERFQALGRSGYVQPDPQGLPDLTAEGRRAVVALVRDVHGSGRSVHSNLPVRARPCK